MTNSMTEVQSGNVARRTIRPTGEAADDTLYLVVAAREIQSTTNNRLEHGACQSDYWLS